MPRTQKTILKPPVESPFTVLVDTREQTPYTFDRIRVRAPRQNEFVVVRKKFVGLGVGDYAAQISSDSLAVGNTSVTELIVPVRIERKSKPDLFGTLGAGRTRFKREMERAADEKLRVFLVAECELVECISDPPPHTELPGMIVVRTLESWAVRYGLNVWWCGSRAVAEQVTYRLLEFSAQHAQHIQHATASENGESIQ